MHHWYYSNISNCVYNFCDVNIIFSVRKILNPTFMTWKADLDLITAKTVSEYIQFSALIANDSYLYFESSYISSVPCLKLLLEVTPTTNQKTTPHISATSYRYEFIYIFATFIYYGRAAVLWTPFLKGTQNFPLYWIYLR